MKLQAKGKKNQGKRKKFGARRKKGKKKNQPIFTLGDENQNQPQKRGRGRGKGKGGSKSQSDPKILVLILTCCVVIGLMVKNIKKHRGYIPRNYDTGYIEGYDSNNFTAEPLGCETNPNVPCRWRD